MTSVRSRSIMSAALIVTLLAATLLAMPTTAAQAGTGAGNDAALAYEVAAAEDGQGNGNLEAQAVPLAAAAVVAAKFAGKAAAAGFFGYAGAKAGQAVFGSTVQTAEAPLGSQAEVVFD